MNVNIDENVQDILTESRLRRRYVAKTSLSANKCQAHEDYVADVLGLSKVYFADKVLAIDEKTDIRQICLESAKNRIEAMFCGNLKETTRNGIELISVQGAKREFLGAFYSSCPKMLDLLDYEKHGHLIRSHSQMSDLTKACLDVLGVTKCFKKHLEREYSPFGTVIKEALQNQAEFATHLDRCLWYKKSIKFLKMSLVGNMFVGFDLESIDSKEIFNNYFAAGRHGHNFLRIDIFDSGSGFAKTYSSKCDYEYHYDADKSREKKFVQECFINFNSAKSGKNSGLGLKRILKSVSEIDGLIKIRTNSCEAMFCNDSSLNIDEPETYVFGNLKSVEGTMIQVLVPYRP